jgi:hypothetical protein|tara:strand:- start:3885 stop:4049 length:165 start_codon:yes stop_codon:yes gene_type:complete
MISKPKDKSILRRINIDLHKYILKIEDKEDCSYVHASKILARILENAGGLKDYP